MGVVEQQGQDVRAAHARGGHQRGLARLRLRQVDVRPCGQDSTRSERGAGARRARKPRRSTAPLTVCDKRAGHVEAVEHGGDVEGGRAPGQRRVQRLRRQEVPVQPVRSVVAHARNRERAAITRRRGTQRPRKLQQQQ